MAQNCLFSPSISLDGRYAYAWTVSLIPCLVSNRCKYTRFSLATFLKFPGFQRSTGSLPASDYPGIHRALAVIFSQQRSVILLASFSVLFVFNTVLNGQYLTMLRQALARKNKVE